MIVVDASMFISWLLNEDASSAQDAVWDVLTTQVALVPAHWPNEVANALRRAVRTKRIAASEIDSVVSKLEVFDIRLSGPPTIADVAFLVGQSLAHDLSVYDLQYLRLAQSHDLPLATVDVALRTAAQRLNLSLLPVPP